jgi:hypothetical protein
MFKLLPVQSLLLKSVSAIVFLASASAQCGFRPVLIESYPTDPTRSRLMEAARAGGDYLVRVQKADGSFFYYYEAASDRFESRRYNIIRHAGATLSLFELYKATGGTRYLESARRAVKFLKTRFRRARGPNTIYVLDFDGKAKLGANGLALIVLATHIELDPKFADRRSATGLANQILAMQRQDGSFETRIRIHENDASGPDSLYYPGESMLGLIRLFALDHNKQLLQAARHAADFLIESQSKMDSLPADAWLMQALEALYLIGHEKRYADHIIGLAEAIIADQYTAPDRHDYVGGFGPGVPRATPAASRAEGLVSAYRVARSIRDSRASRIAASLEASARFQLAQQFTSRNGESLRNPARAAGGFRESLTSMRVRIDFVQHNISSLLGIADVLY